MPPKQCLGLKQGFSFPFATFQNPLFYVPYYGVWPRRVKLRGLCNTKGKMGLENQYGGQKEGELGHCIRKLIGEFFDMWSVYFKKSDIGLIDLVILSIAKYVGYGVEFWEPRP